MEPQLTPQLAALLSLANAAGVALQSVLRFHPDRDQILALADAKTPALATLLMSELSELEAAVGLPGDAHPTAAEFFLRRRAAADLHNRVRQLSKLPMAWRVLAGMHAQEINAFCVEVGLAAAVRAGGNLQPDALMTWFNRFGAPNLPRLLQGAAGIVTPWPGELRRACRDFVARRAADRAGEALARWLGRSVVAEPLAQMSDEQRELLDRLALTSITPLLSKQPRLSEQASLSPDLIRAFVDLFRQQARKIWSRPWEEDER